MIYHINDRVADFSAVFESIMFRINENRPKQNKVIILDTEKNNAIKEYCKTYQDFVTFRGV